MPFDNFLVDSASDDADSPAQQAKSGHAPTEQGMPRLSQKRKKPFGRAPRPYSTTFPSTSYL